MHLNTRACVCGGHTFTIKDIQGRLESLSDAGIKDPNFYGGQVKSFAPSSCPVCEKDYQLWLKPAGQTWDLVTISARGWDPNAVEEESETMDDFSYMKKPELVAWLKEREVEYVPQWGEPRLRDTARASVAAQQTKPEEEEGNDVEV